MILSHVQFDHFSFGLVSGILSVPLCLSPVHRTCSHFTMHSYKIINISTLTSQIGGKWLVNSGHFLPGYL